MDPHDLVIDSIGGISPTQAEGTVYGWPFYFRAEGGTWHFRILATIMGERFQRMGTYERPALETADVRVIVHQCAEDFMTFVEEENLW